MITLKNVIMPAFYFHENGIKYMTIHIKGLKCYDYI